MTAADSLSGHTATNLSQEKKQKKSVDSLLEVSNRPRFDLLPQLPIPIFLLCPVEWEDFFAGKPPPRELELPVFLTTVRKKPGSVVVDEEEDREATGNFRSGA